MKHKCINTKVNNLIYIILICICSLTLFSSCDDDDTATPKELTILEKHTNTLKSINVLGNNLTYLEYGTSREKTILLLHGVPTSSLLFRNIAKQLSENTGFRVIALDLLGFGNSDKPNTVGAYTLDSQTKNVYAFVDALNIDNFALAVHDSGGFIAWNMMLDEQFSRVDGILVTDTALEFDGFTPPEPMIPIFQNLDTPRNVWSSLLKNTATQKETAASFLSAGISKQDILSDELINAYAAAMTQPETYIELFESINGIVEKTPLVIEKMNNFDKPVAILWGKEDAFVDATIMTKKFKGYFNLSDDNIKILEGTNHYLQEDATSQYIDFLSGFLNENFN